MKNIDLNQFPQPPANAVFSLQKAEKVLMPHPYCLTSAHIAYAADNFGGMLGAEAIRAAEKAGDFCDTCSHSHRGILTYDQHENLLTLFIKVPQNRDLNAVKGLHTYLHGNKKSLSRWVLKGSLSLPNIS